MKELLRNARQILDQSHWPEGREGSMDAMIRKPGNLPVVDTGKPERSGSPGHEDLAVSKKCCAIVLCFEELRIAGFVSLRAFPGPGKALS